MGALLVVFGNYAILRTPNLRRSYANPLPLCCYALFGCSTVQLRYLIPRSLKSLLAHRLIVKRGGGRGRRQFVL